MTQTELADFAGFKTQVLDALKRMNKNLEESRSSASLYQEQNAHNLHAFRALKGELVEEHASKKWYDNRKQFATMRRQVYDLFVKMFKEWDGSGEGVFHVDVVHRFKEVHKWIENGLDDTIDRRLRELTNPKICEPPPLRRTQPGYYVLAKISMEAP